MGGTGVRTEPTAAWGGLVILPVNGSRVCSLYQNHMTGFAQQSCALSRHCPSFTGEAPGVTPC